MEIDVEQWILNAACRQMRNEFINEKANIVYALVEMYPELSLLQRVRQQVKEYKKLTMWES